jgi:hypothetical protein
MFSFAALMPAALLLVLLAWQTCFYSRHLTLIVLAGVVIAAALAIAGLAMLRRTPRALLTHTLPALVYLFVAVGPLRDVRDAITDGANTLRFFYHYDDYKQELNRTGSAAMKEWLMGHQGVIEYAVIFDASHEQYRNKLYNDASCRSHAFSPVNDFYIVTRVCP